MTRTANRSRFVALALTTALATTALSGCATNTAPRADLSAGKAQVALQKGNTGQAVEHAEAAVLAEPRNASYRAMLGAAYMEAGRFQSAATSFKDAMSLGDNAPRTALSYALAEIAADNNSAAVAVLDDWREDLDPADLGLALALAGQPDQGVHVLGNTLRSGQSNAKVRQNLAYAYALQGNWSAARIMAAEDVPGDQLDARISEWAHSAKPEDYQTRVAALLEVPVVADSGQPVALALNNHPSAEQLAAQAAAMSPGAIETAAPATNYAYARSTGELPPLEMVQAPPQVQAPAQVQATPQVAVAQPQPKAPASFEDAFERSAPAGASLAQVAESAVRFMADPVVQSAPSRMGAAPKKERDDVSTPPATGTHLVQLGSFSSEAGARRAWGIYAKRYSQLSQYDMVITQARVRGKNYFRVSAGGFKSASARSMCSTVKSSGHGCIAWAANSPLPGALDRGTRMAAR